MIQKFSQIVFTLIAICLLTTAAQANNLSISNVSLGTRNPGANSLIIKFNVSWDHSWHNKINHDAVWLTVRLNNTSDSIINKKICEVSASGTNPAGSSVGTATNLEFYVPSDKKGAFLRRSSNGNVMNVSTQGAQLTIDYSSCGFSDDDQIIASVFGVEMVFIPQGDFYAGDYDTSTASLDQGSADNRPWHIINENAISVSNSSTGGYRYLSNNNSGEVATGASFTIPNTFPKGYAPFYVMKYEITEGQWVEFINSLGSAAARDSRDLTDNNHKNSDAVTARNTISCSGSPLSCSTLRPARAVSFLSWMDLAAFLDWNALRPMSELEFEKIARGPVLPIPGEYVWGNTTVTPATDLSGDEDGSEIITTTDANVNILGNSTFAGGDAQAGAIRAGIFSTSATNRTTSGAGYYGVMELSGNLKERVVTIGNPSALTFDGTQEGDGVLTLTSGFEGNANTAFWPGTDASPANGVTGADGSGLRGGSWSDLTNSLLRTSDRSEAALSSTSAASNFGGRGVRTYDGN